MELRLPEGKDLRKTYKKTMKQVFLTLFLISFAVQLSVDAQQLNYPATKRVEQTDDFFGVKVADPYRWMEDANSDELKSWVKSQDELLKSFVGKNPKRADIQKRLLELIKYDSYTNATGLMTPFVAKRNTRYFFIETKAGSNIPTLFVKEGINGKPRVLLDFPSRYQADKINLRGYEPSPDGNFVALFLSKDNSRWLTIKILDVKTGKDLNEVLEDFHPFSSNIAWTADNKGFFYTKFDKKPQGEGQPPVQINPKVYFHVLGDSQNQDSLIYEKPNNQVVVFTYQVTGDGKYLVINELDGSNPYSRIYYKEISGSQIKPIFDKEDANYIFLGNRGTQFWFYTNLNAPRGRVIATDIKNPSLREVVPQAKEAMSAGSSVGGNAIGIFGNKIVLAYVKDSNPLIRVFSFQGKLEKEVLLPSGGNIWGGFAGTQSDNEVLYEYLGLTSPATFYRLDVKTKQNTIFLEPKLNLKPSDYEIKQVFYKSKDGTRVPMFIAHRKGLKLDGNNPAYMYGYGAFGWVALMFYQPNVLTWLDMGGVFAVPGIRGGGEYGDEWHQAGVGKNRQNSIDDFIAATEFLINNKYTSPKKMVANGSSAGSAVAAAAVLQRSELYAAAIIDIPILDMMRFQQFTSGRYWQGEFGSSEKKEEFQTLISYSPYHNLKKGNCYPPTLVMVGEKDQTALPLHGYKFTANLQHSQGCANPVLVKTMWGTGHNFGATAEQRIDSWADSLSFLFNVLK